MLKINEINRLYLGIQGENNAHTIQIDVRDWMVGHENGSFSIWHKRNGDSVPAATGATFDSETGILSWSPTSTDTYVAGEGMAEIRMTENSIIKKTMAVTTGVSPSVTGAGVPLGSGWQDYIDEVDRIKSLAVAAKEAAETAQGKAEDAKEDAEAAQEAAEIAAGIAIAQAGQLKFEINEATGHLMMSYTDEVPIAEED